MPADAEVFSSPGQTALNRTRENSENYFARKATVESSAALTGAMKP